jgi:hypothetical protein
MRFLNERVERPSNIDENSLSSSIIRLLEGIGLKAILENQQRGPVGVELTFGLSQPISSEKQNSVEDLISSEFVSTVISLHRSSNCIVIKFPLQNPPYVRLLEILETEDWANNNSKIPLALGIDNRNKPIIFDLFNTENILISGARGSGKSTTIHSIITALLYHSSPEDLRFVIVDPKVLEMQVYNRLPHLLIPVVTDTENLIDGLKYLLDEIENRNQLFVQLDVRSLVDYHARMAQARCDAKEAEQRAIAMDCELTPEERAAAANIVVPNQKRAPDKLPYIVCIVDELADLQAWGQIEEVLSRILPLSHKAGVHFVFSCDRSFVSKISARISDFLRFNVYLTHVPDVLAVDNPTFFPAGSMEIHHHSDISNQSMREDPGYVYIMRNPGMQDEIVKIGLTRSDPEERATQLSTATGVPNNFEVVFSRKTLNCRTLESSVHKALGSRRISKNREFFRCSVSEAVDTIERLRMQIEFGSTFSSTCLEGRGVFVSDDEISRIISHIWEMNGGPEFTDYLQCGIESSDINSGFQVADWDDELVPEAIEVIRLSRRATPSMLMRRLRIGYNRAARIMEILEAQGLVGPENGSSPREILMDLDY